MFRNLWFSIIAAASIGAMSDADVIMVNDTGVPIVRIQINHRTFEDGKGVSRHNKILVSISPDKHQLKLIFRGGAEVNWPRFNFEGVHEIFFERTRNKIQARIE